MRVLFSLLVLLFLSSCGSNFVPPEPVSYKDIKGDLQPINPDMITQEQINQIRAEEARIGKKKLPDLTDVRKTNGD